MVLLLYRFLHLTDIHMGAVQDPNEIEGFNAYSPEIADNRAVDLTVRWLNWVNYQRKAYKRIDEAAVIITGDIISGDIHEELRTTNAFPISRAGCQRSRTYCPFSG